MPTQGSRGRVLSAGKIPLELLTRLLADLPSPPAEVRLGARLGEDACAIDVADGVIVAAADPITLTSEDAGRLAVTVNANDIAVCGARPRWFVATVLLPPGSTEDVVEGLFRSIRTALADLDAYLVGGHTEVTSAVTRPVVVGHMLGLAEFGLVTTAGFSAGDAVVQVKSAPIEGAVVLAREAGDLARLEPTLLLEARNALESPGISVVEPALLAASLGASALHDPTEGGLAGGLHEMAAAAELGIVVDREAVLWFAPGVAVCEALGADPWGTLASGTLLATFPGSKAHEAVRVLNDGGHEAAVIGRVEQGAGVRTGTGEPIPWPDRDEVARLLSDRGQDEHPGTI